MTETEADALLHEVGTMLTEAIDGIQYRAGNSTTKVLAGFPFTVVGSYPTVSATAESPEAAAPARDLIWTSEKSTSGTRVFFMPLDPATRIGSDLCYSDDPPSFLIPPSTSKMFLLKRTFEVGTAVDGSTEYPTDIIPGESVIEMYDDDAGDMPVSTYPLGSDENSWNTAGTYVLYFFLLRITGQNNVDLTASDYQTIGNAPAPIIAAYAANNEWARSLFLGGDTSYMHWLYYGDFGIPLDLLRQVPGDMSGISAGLSAT